MCTGIPEENYSGLGKSEIRFNFVFVFIIIFSHRIILAPFTLGTTMVARHAVPLNSTKPFTLCGRNDFGGTLSFISGVPHSFGVWHLASG
jgi:hypothetical protein